MYQMSYIVNLAIAVVIFCVLSVVFPPVDTGTAEPWDAVSGNAATPNEPSTSRVLGESEDKEARQLEIECV